MTIVELQNEITGRIRLGNADPEVGHALIDDLLIEVIRDAARGENVTAKAQMLAALLDREKAEDWDRWYA